MSILSLGIFTAPKDHQDQNHECGVFHHRLLGQGLAQANKITESDSPHPEIQAKVAGSGGTGKAGCWRRLKIDHLEGFVSNEDDPELIEWVKGFAAAMADEDLDRQHPSIQAALLHFGVPNLERAVYSANHVLTLIAQDHLQPFAKDADASNSSDPKLNEMQLYQLPWPIPIPESCQSSKSAADPLRPIAQSVQ